MIGAQAKLATVDADDDILQQMCTGDDNNSVLEAKFELGLRAKNNVIDIVSSNYVFMQLIRTFLYFLF